MFDSKRILDQLVNSGLNGGLAEVIADARVTPIGANKARKRSRVVLQAGGLALIANLAYKAWQSYSGNHSAVVSPIPSAFAPDDPADSSFLNMLLVRSMIAASRADGTIDAQEPQSIRSGIERLDLGDKEKAFVFEQFTTPVDINGLARDANSRAHAIEMYAAAALMLEFSSPDQRRHLDDFASALALDEDLRQEIHRALLDQAIAA